MAGSKTKTTLPLHAVSWLCVRSYMLGMLTRAHIVFKYGSKIQSDADIMRRGAETDDSFKRQSEHKRQTATDDAALERFKKRQRNQLKR